MLLHLTVVVLQFDQVMSSVSEGGGPLMVCLLLVMGEVGGVSSLNILVTSGNDGISTAEGMSQCEQSLASDCLRVF